VNAGCDRCGVSAQMGASAAIVVSMSFRARNGGLPRCRWRPGPPPGMESSPPCRSEPASGLIAPAGSRAARTGRNTTPDR
jgi:hypothetical protein